MKSTVGAATRLSRAVDDAPSAIADGARKALDGARELGTNLRRDPIGTIRSGARQALEGAKELGKWSWKHKGEIGFFAATTALMLATPVTGGASGAVAGGMLAARGAVIAAKVGQLGRAGAASVKAARVGAHAVQKAKGAMGATKAGHAARSASNVVHSGRVKLGSTRLGAGMTRLQKPVAITANTAWGMHFADTAQKYARGKATGKDMTLATLGVTPLGFAGLKHVGRTKMYVDDVIGKAFARRGSRKLVKETAAAANEATHVAVGASRVHAPQTAGAASAARADANVALERALQIRTQAKVQVKHSGADAKALSDELGSVAERARLARKEAEQAARLAPDARITRRAHAATARLEKAEDQALRTKRTLDHFVTRKERTREAVKAASAAETATANASVPVFLADSTSRAVQENSRNVSTTDVSAMRNAGWILEGLTRRAR